MCILSVADACMCACSFMDACVHVYMCVCVFVRKCEEVHGYALSIYLIRRCTVVRVVLYIRAYYYIYSDLGVLCSHTVMVLL